MPTRPEMLSDGTLGREEALSVVGRFESLHPSLPPPGGLMRALCSTVEISMLAMFHSREQLSLSRCIALEFIGNNYSRHVAQFLEQFTEELRGRLLVASRWTKVLRTFPS